MNIEQELQSHYFVGDPTLKKFFTIQEIIDMVQTYNNNNINKNGICLEKILFKILKPYTS